MRRTDKRKAKIKGNAILHFAKNQTSSLEIFFIVSLNVKNR